MASSRSASVGGGRGAARPAGGEGAWPAHGKVLGVEGLGFSGTLNLQDQRTADVLAWLHQAVAFHLTSKACELKKFEGPRKATKQELIQTAQDISPTHNWVVKEGTRDALGV